MLIIARVSTFPVFKANAILGYESCSVTGPTNSTYSDCDSAGYVTQYECYEDTSCDSCTQFAQYSTECVAYFGIAMKGVCGGLSDSDDDADDDADETCFSGDDTLTLSSGEIKIFSEVRVGDEVLTADAKGALSFAPVVALPHERNSKLASFVHVELSSGKSVKATKMHMLQKCDGSLAYANSLSVGDCLQTQDGDELVSSISATSAIGIYTAVTTNEFLVVNGIVASPFAVAHGLPNAFYSLHRNLVSYFPSALKSSLLLAANAFLGGAFITAGK